MIFIDKNLDFWIEPSSKEEEFKMEVKKIRGINVVFLVMVMGLGMLVEQSSATFKDCYAKCFVLCMIEPSQTLCSCTTQCFKECIFSNTSTGTGTDEFHEQTSSYDFCKLGCAFTMCSDISKKGKPSNYFTYPIILYIWITRIT